MNRFFLNVTLMTFMATTGATVKNHNVIRVDDELSFRTAIDAANHDKHINKIIIQQNTHMELNSPVIYEGEQALEIMGNGAEIDGRNAGSFELDENSIAITKDATLIFNTASKVILRDLSVVNSSTRGIAINIPVDATGKDIEIILDHVTISNSALYGFHVDDNADDFDDGIIGSDIGVDLKISHSSFTHNGVGAIDFDGIRVDERGLGSIYTEINHTHIDMNGGDGIELDEGGPGDVLASIRHSSFNENGFYNDQDLDDGFDIDENDDGDVDVNLFDVEIKANQDEGLDVDENGEGDVYTILRKITAAENFNEAIKVDEEGAGDIFVRMSRIMVNDNGDDGIQYTEQGDGMINARLKKVASSNNKKYGVKMEQWLLEADSSETAGIMMVKNLSLQENGKGNQIKTNNLMVKQK